MDHHEENQTSTLLQKPQAIHFVEWCGKVFAGTLSGFILKVSINFQIFKFPITNAIYLPNRIVIIQEFIFNPNRKAIEHIFLSNIITIFLISFAVLCLFLYFIYYKFYIQPREKLANDIYFLVNVSSPRNVSLAPRKTSLTEIALLPKSFIPQYCVALKTTRKQRSKTPDSNKRKKNRRNSSSGSKKRNKRRNSSTSSKKNSDNNNNTTNTTTNSKNVNKNGSKINHKRSSTPPRININNDSKWGDYIGNTLNQETIKQLKWINPKLIEEKEYFSILNYGNYIAVKRQSGRKVVVGRIESNYNGKPLREWNKVDVSQWLNRCINIRCFPSILNILKNRPAQLLIDLSWLAKNLNEADFKTLELELYKCFEYEIKKELKEKNSYFR